MAREQLVGGSLVARMVQELYQALSQTRLQAYRPGGGSDLEMLTNYF